MLSRFRLATLATFALAALPLISAAQDKPKDEPKEKKGKPAAELIVGKWKLAKTDSKLPAGASAVVEIKKDGTISIEFSIDDKKQATIEGTYELSKDGKTIKTVMKNGTEEKSETATIEKLTEDEFILIDEKKSKDSFTRVKEEKK